MSARDPDDQATSENRGRDAERGLDDLAGMASATLDAAGLAGVVRALAGSARAAGAKAVASGQWAAKVVIDAVPRIPVRDAATLRADYGGLSGPALAGALITDASRQTAAVGAASGALTSASELAPPGWLAVPLELVVSTLAVAVVELKLVAELHEAYGRRMQGDGWERTSALLRAWAERRAVGVVASRSPFDHVVGGTYQSLLRMVRRRLLQRLGRNLTTLGPLLTGAVAGAELNRRATRSLGEAIVRDLTSGTRSPGGA